MSRIRLSADGRELEELDPGGRLLGITGAPGSGKSTLAAALAAAHAGVVVPMDGFHLADVELERRGVSRVDQPNAALVEAVAERADLVLDLTDWTG